ncbi:hypothetical protein [Mycolicibacterium septicum]|jgi:hypothetical protein
MSVHEMWNAIRSDQPEHANLFATERDARHFERLLGTVIPINRYTNAITLPTGERITVVLVRA